LRKGNPRRNAGDSKTNLARATCHKIEVDGTLGGHAPRLLCHYDVTVVGEVVIKASSYEGIGDSELLGLTGQNKEVTTCVI
jgi:hypothetical protein